MEREMGRLFLSFRSLMFNFFKLKIKLELFAFKTVIEVKPLDIRISKLPKPLIFFSFIVLEYSYYKFVRVLCDIFSVKWISTAY